MGHVDIFQTKRIRGKDDIAASLMIFKLSVMFELDLPDCPARRVGNEEIAFLVEGEAVGHKRLRTHGVRRCSVGVDFAGR